MDPLERALAGRRGTPVRAARVKVTATAPLTIQLPDGATVPAVGIKNTTYAVNDPGIALFLGEGSTPIVWPTTI